MTRSALPVIFWGEIEEHGLGKFKGIGIVFVRDKIAAWGEHSTEEFLGTLEAGDREIYERTLATSWVPVETAERILGSAAAYLYPGDVEGLRHIGREMAATHLTSTYRILLRVASVPFALSQTANYWRAYHDEGRAISSKGDQPRTAHLVVEEYPELPKPFRGFVDGYIHGLMDLTGVRNGLVIRDDRDPNAWRWDLSWD